MPSKTTFALVAVLAASVSALPTRGYSYVDLVERGDPVVAATPAVPAVPATPVAAVQPPVAAIPSTGGATTPGAGATNANAPAHPHHHSHHPHHHKQQRLSASDPTHPAHHRHHKRKSNSVDGTTTHHHRHQHQHQHANANAGAVSPTVDAAASPLTPPVTGGAASAAAPAVGAGKQTLTRREFYESLYVRDPTGHHHGHHHGPPHGHHHGHHGHHHQQAQASAPVDPSAGAPPADPAPAGAGLARRGLLETLGLRARVANLTVKQTEKMNKAKAICGNLSSKKDQHRCHKNVDKIIQLTKERNYDVEQFDKETNHHDVFTSSDPTSSSSSSSKHT